LIIDNHFLKEAERQLAELRSAEKTNLIQTIRKAVQHTVPFIVSVFSNILDYIDQRKTGAKLRNIISP
jgi:hypothetical protein